MLSFETIKTNVSAEIVEKKSKFIADIFYVENIEEAENYIKQIKKKYHDAKHHCFAYAIEAGNGGVAVKYNDDGEPQRYCWSTNTEANTRKRFIERFSCCY